MIAILIDSMPDNFIAEVSIGDKFYAEFTVIDEYKNWLASVKGKQALLTQFFGDILVCDAELVTL